MAVVGVSPCSAQPTAGNQDNYVHRWESMLPKTVKSVSKQSSPNAVVIVLINDRSSSPAVWSELLRKCTAGLMIAINPAQRNLQIGNRIYCAGPEFCQFRFPDTVSLLEWRKSGKAGQYIRRRLLVRPAMPGQRCADSVISAAGCVAGPADYCNGLGSHPGPPVCSSC